ncbi:MAG: MmcQ/YjbR family DNA-binding protein [Sphingobium sp.]|nr:MmcQ/YjbR family DNA-binding protein [Sphingobium sp.]
MTLPASVADLKAVLDALPGAAATPFAPPRAESPLSLLYKVGGKMFAVLTLRGDLYVVLKAPPFMVDMLREQYAGVGKRTHLDPRHWIAIDLASDVPAEEIASLARGSYELVRGSLPKKQQATL